MPSQMLLAGQVLLGRAGHRLTDGGVLVDGGTITAVGTRRDLEQVAPPDALRREFPHATLLPGMINAHVHLAFQAAPGVVEALEETADEALLEMMTARARTMLDRGITTVRDLADRGGLAVALRDRVARDEVVGPRIVSATAPLTPPGGHCWFLGGEVDGPAAISDRIRHNAVAGADLIKVMVSGGGLTPGGAQMWESQFDTDTLTRIVGEAHDLGLPVAAHAHSPETIAAAAYAGVDTIEHALWMAEGKVFVPDDDVAALIADRGIAVCLADVGDWRRFADRLGVELSRGYYGRVRWLDDHGVTLIAGTDAGVYPFEDYTDVLRRHVDDWGLSTERVLETATVNAAHSLGLAGQVGELVAGASADCLVVRGDPRADLAALHDIELVMARGRDVPRS